LLWLNIGENVKILLLNPPMHYGAYNEAGRIYVDKSYPPLGLGYLAAVLEKEGYDVKLIDMIDTSFKDAERIIRGEKPQVVGISCNLTDFRWGAFELAKIAKRVDSNMVVVLGGSHATHLYKQILENFPVDIIVRFEGEFAFLEVVKALETGSDLKSVKGIVYRDGGKIVKTEDRQAIDNLDSLPFPAYHFFDFDKYVHYASPVKFKGKNVSELKSSNMMASRGCPYHCKYCSISTFWHSCRFRTVNNVVDEMEFLHENYGVTHFNFFDDVFTLDKARVEKLCREIIRRKLDISWECVTRVDFVSDDMLAWMKKAGCLSISYGVESGSPTVLNAVNKKQTLDQIVRAFHMTHKHGILAYILLMVGNPNESNNSIDETIDLLRIIKPDKIRTTLTMVYPATDLYSTCKEKGWIDDEYWLTKKAAPIYTVENSVGQLQKWESKIVFSYYMQRGKIVKLLEILFYRAFFKNLREIARRLGSRVDERVERIDHMLHST
jgi:radical SAM superfamily enzyme YgiQ (UPF0313 family)